MAKYNRASRLASAVAEIWRRETGRGDPHIAAALASSDSAEAADRMRKILLAQSATEFSPRELTARFEHFLMESKEIIPEAGDALTAGDLQKFGAAVDRSQELTEILLDNQVPETVFLARVARELGAAAASAFGAGFGGSVWALVEEASAEDLLKDWARRYREAFPEVAAKECALQWGLVSVAHFQQRNVGVIPLCSEIQSAFLMPPLPVFVRNFVWGI